MSKRRLVITAVLAGSTQSQVARTYGVSQGWISRLMARYRREGEAAFEPHSRRPHHSPTATPADTVELIIRLRKQLAEDGLDAGPETIAWHLEYHHRVRVSAATISRYLSAHGMVTPQPSKRPRSSYIRFQAEQPNECWQADFTHYRLTNRDGTPGADCEILTWLDDHSRKALSVTAHRRVTGPVVLDTFRQTVADQGIPASTLTDNGMVFTTRLAGGRGGRNALEHQLRAWNVVQKNSRPNHPTTCGKVERFQQTMKKWLHAQRHQPATIGQLQTLIEKFVQAYNQQRPHRSLPHRATPATAYTLRPKATPTGHRDGDVHWRTRTDRVDDTGAVSLRYHGRLHHIGLGRDHARTPIIMLIADRHIRVLHATTGTPIRELELDPTRDYQPRGIPPGPKPHKRKNPNPK